VSVRITLEGPSDETNTFLLWLVDQATTSDYQVDIRSIKPTPDGRMAELEAS
jgi:hypothetical protein